MAEGAVTLNLEDMVHVDVTEDPDETTTEGMVVTEIPSALRHAIDDNSRGISRQTGGSWTYASATYVDVMDHVMQSPFDLNSREILRDVGENVEGTAARVVQETIDSKNSAGKMDKGASSPYYMSDALAVVARSPFNSGPNILALLAPMTNVVDGKSRWCDSTLEDVCAIVGSRINPKRSEIFSYDVVTQTISLNEINVNKYHVTEEEVLAVGNLIFQMMYTGRFNALRRAMELRLRATTLDGTPDTHTIFDVTDFEFVKYEPSQLAHHQEPSIRSYTTKADLAFVAEVRSKRPMYVDSAGVEYYGFDDNVQQGTMPDMQNVNYVYDPVQPDSMTQPNTQYTTLWFNDRLLRTYGLTPYYIASHLGDDCLHERNGETSRITCRSTLLRNPASPSMLVYFRLSFDQPEKIIQMYEGPDCLLLKCVMDSVLTNQIHYIIAGGLMSYEAQMLYSIRLQLSVSKSISNFYQDAVIAMGRMITGAFTPYDERVSDMYGSVLTAANVSNRGVARTTLSLSFRPPHMVDGQGTVATGLPLHVDNEGPFERAFGDDYVLSEPVDDEDLEEQD